MHRPVNQIAALVGLGLCLSLAVSAALGGGFINCQLGLDADKFMWDRLRETGSTILSPGLCDGTAPDSLNDGLPFCAFPAQVTDTNFWGVQVFSQEINALDFDPIVLMYCNEFSPSNPSANLMAIDDDGAGYPNAEFFFGGGAGAAIGDTIVIVVTSYSAFNGSEFGNFQISLTGLQLVGPCACSVGSCAGDANADGVVNFADITDVLANWLNDYTPGTGPGDANGDGVVNFGDITEVLGTWLANCP